MSDCHRQSLLGVHLVRHGLLCWMTLPCWTAQWRVVLLLLLLLGMVAAVEELHYQ